MTNDSLLEFVADNGHYEDLLCSPPEGFKGEAIQLQRQTAVYENKGHRFILSKKLFENQYSKAYKIRFNTLRPRVIHEAQRRWPEVQACNVLDLQEGVLCCLVGIVYKSMKLKPTILDEYTKDKSLQQHTGRTRFCSDDDSLVLEDEGARIGLTGQHIPSHMFVTGMIIGVKGVAHGDQFMVDEYCLAAMDLQPPLPTLSQDKYVAFVCGLNVGDDEGNPLKTSLMLDYLGGLLGAGAEQQLVSKVVRVVLAGGLLSSTVPLYSSSIMSGAKQQHAAVAPLKELDMCLCQLASLAPVDVMAGESDPASHSLPQQPLHSCLLPAASRFDSFQCVTNPHDFEVEGVRLLGTSGQNIDDMYRYSGYEDRLQMMECTLNCAHLVPTAPDTLTAYPFDSHDPFVVSSPPHVYFVANQPEFAVRQMAGPNGQSVLLMALPQFTKTGTVVLLNLRTLQCHPLSFEVPRL